MTRTRRNLLLVAGVLLAAAGTWAAFRFLIGEAPPAQPEYLPQAGAAPAPTTTGPAAPVRQADGTLLVRCFLPVDEGMAGYLLTYGTWLTVLEPALLRDALADTARKVAALYET